MSIAKVPLSKKLEFVVREMLQFFGIQDFGYTSLLLRGRRRPTGLPEGKIVDISMNDDYSEPE